MKQDYEYKKKNGPIKIILLSLIVILVAMIVGGYFYYKHLLSPVDIDGEDKIVEIPKGYSVKRIASLLEEEGVIRKGFAFEIAVRLEKVQGNLQSGKYVLNNSMGTMEVIEKISSGEVLDDSIKVTIPEGFELSMIAERLEELGFTSKEDFMDASTQLNEYEYVFLKDIPSDRQYPLEGYLFPDTYHFSPEVTNDEVIDAMLSRFDEVFKEEYYNRAEELDMTIDEVVIMSSLVEREAKHQEERALIAGVYYNRLDIGMKLQCDATVQYALGERKTRLLYSDLEIDSPYNTYKYYGLPIGPISSVGDASIKAALYPEDSEYIYYVAKEDGRHVFSRTYEEHKKAIKEIRE